MTGVLDTMLGIATEAARVVSGVYQTAFGVDYKSPEDPVTAADRDANELICARLAAEYPSIPVVAEESAPERFERFRDSDRVFFVDPLDGTREFVLRNGEFVVMIGLVSGERASHGVILAPATGIAWCGEVGAGAFQVDADGRRTPLTVSTIGSLRDARLVASRSHRSEALEQAIAVLGVREVLTLGSAGLKGAAVARGAAEAYVAPAYAGKRWDACASDALVTAAGGRYSDVFGAPIDYRGESLDNDRGLCASNGALHEQLLDGIRRVGEAHG